MHLYKHKSAPGIDKLYVICTVSNPARFKSRYELYHRFKLGCERVGVQLVTVELALGDRPFEVTDAGNPRHVQLRTWDELWLKESCINIGISRLPQDWEYVAWIDADTEILRHDWPAEICHLLQQYQVIQLFDTAVDLAHDGSTLQINKGFVSTWQERQGSAMAPGDYYYAGTAGKAVYHPGFAWAARREAIDALGGLFDTAILGSGDHHMAWGLVGKIGSHTPRGLTPAYHRNLTMWQDRATRHIRQDVGFMAGTLVHHFHGAKRNRFYRDRWKILQQHKYDPDRDLKRDWQGLWSFSDQGVRMRNDLRSYFRQRSEDSIES